MQYLQIVIARLSTRQRRRPWQPKDVVADGRTSLGCRGAQRCRVAHLATTNWRRHAVPSDCHCEAFDATASIEARPFIRRWLPMHGLLADRVEHPQRGANTRFRQLLAIGFNTVGLVPGIKAK